VLGLDAGRVVTGIRLSDDKPGGMVATDLTSGQELWRAKRAPASTGVSYAFALSGDRLAYAYQDPEAGIRYRLTVHDATTGKHLWHTADTEVLGIGDRWLVGVEWLSTGEAFKVSYFNA
ncbi:MAG: hypothetical protein ACRDT8_22895, partial [Micromonosporaceae bacterium]